MCSIIIRNSKLKFEFEIIKFLRFPTRPRNLKELTVFKNTQSTTRHSVPQRWSRILPAWRSLLNKKRSPTPTQNQFWRDPNSMATHMSKNAHLDLAKLARVLKFQQCNLKKCLNSPPILWKVKNLSHLQISKFRKNFLKILRKSVLKILTWHNWKFGRPSKMEICQLIPWEVG